MSKYSTVDRGKTIPVRSPEIFRVHNGKGFIVTGGAGGIGKAIVELLLAQGAKVALADVNESSARAAAEALGGEAAGCHAVAMDVGAPDSIAQGISLSEEKLGRIDGLVNCAAIVRHSAPPRSAGTTGGGNSRSTSLGPMRRPGSLRSE